MSACSALHQSRVCMIKIVYMLLPHYYHGLVEAGCDEAGRGCLAGSVYAAAVILPPDYDNPALNDSKQLSSKKRYALREQIEHDALAWAVGIATPQEIDEINILHASFLAMHRALDQLKVRPEALIIDGNHFDPYVVGAKLPDAGSNCPTLASSRATENTRVLPPPPSWPRPIAMITWWNRPASTPFMTGKATRAIPPKALSGN